MPVSCNVSSGPEAACDGRKLLRSRTISQPLGALSACGYIYAKGPFPRITILNVDRSAPNNRIDLLAVADSIGSTLKCQNTGCRREHRARGVGDANALDIASGPSPILQSIGFGCEVGAKNVDKGDIFGRQ